MKARAIWTAGVFVLSGVMSVLYMNMSRPLLETHVDYYLSPTGNDANDGLSASKPLKTLARAHALVASRFKTQPIDVEINIAPGTYFNQTTVWKTIHPDYYVVIKGTDPVRKPVFDGRLDSGQALGNQKSFFVLSASGAFSNLTIENIKVQYYAEAITFSGSRDNFDTGFNGNNKVRYNVFDKIGSKYHKDQGVPAYAAVRFVNSRFNTVIGNIFTNIHNATRGELLHALYIAHYSSYNSIEGKAFRLHSGDPVRVRDFSNFNKIFKNEFDRAGAYGYSEWYCEKAESSACTKPLPECPSWGSRFTDNIIKGVSTFKIYVRPTFSNATSACKTPAPAEASGKRLSTANNITNTKQLVVTPLRALQYYAFCPSLDYCVSSSGACYANGKGTTHWACSNKVWYSCTSDKDVGQIRSGAKCTVNGTSYSWVY